MIWPEVVKFYGEEIASKMQKSKWLQGITLIVVDKRGRPLIREEDAIALMARGKAFFDFPEEDLDRAYRDVCGMKIHGWD